LGSSKIFIRFCLLLFGLLISLALNAQRKSYFSGDSLLFAGELNTFFQNIDDNERKIVAPVLEKFTADWLTINFTPERSKKIYKICNEMVRKKIRPFPDFYNYLRTLVIFVETGQPKVRFDPWTDILLKLAEEKNARPFLTFLEMTMHLFEENLVYHSASTRWHIDKSDYQFGFDSVPFLSFAKCHLTCHTSKDSMVIFDTRGNYFPLATRWEGTGGTTNWERAGLSSGEVFAELGDYTIIMRYARFGADSVKLYNRKYFREPLLGSYLDKVMIDIPEERASYPRFASYEKMISISGLFRNIDYIGGFSMEGSRVIGKGDKEKDARIFIKMDGKDLMVVQSRSFIIRPDRINAANASITLYHDNDSIYHPGLQMKYLDSDTLLSFSKDERVVSVSPWFDSWHKIEIYCEALNWRVGDPKLKFEMMKGSAPGSESNAVFESSNYYSESRYEKLQGIDAINPLNLIKQYTDLRKSREFTLRALSDYMKKPDEQVEVMLIKLANRGFLVYDQDDKIARVKDKLYDYVKARSGKSDYDGIFFNSTVTTASNGELDLLTFDLKISGVPSIFVSDSQKVYIFPAKQEVTLKKDRDFTFNGKIEAGKFDFYTKNSSFEYSSFKVNLPEVDSMIFYVRSRTPDPKTGTFPLIRVRSAITNLSGDLRIDDPKNKSGHNSPPEYPIFTNHNNARVNWDKASIHKGVYKKDTFYFDVYPFTIHSLDVVATDSLDFHGHLISAGIFPRIDEPLRVRPDYSLGFEKFTPPEGLPAYGGRGTFINRIDLSDRGLHGEGTFRYLHSVSTNPDIIFYPDSMKTLAVRFEAMEQLTGVEYPTVIGDSVAEFWLPYKDSLILTTTTRELTMYNDQSSFAGRLSLTPQQFTGDGLIRIKDAEMDSKGFKFKSRTFDALIANFRIKAYNLEDLTIQTRNYQTHFDFDKRRGEFRSNLGVSLMEFPLNRYICSMDRFDWLIDNEEIMLMNERELNKYSDSLSLSQLIDVGYTGSEFISVHPLQDSLRFFAARARYNLRTNVISAEDVKIVKVADAAIFPDSGHLSIYRDAVMETLRRAQIIANTKSRFHSFYNATVSIGSRKNYTANGYYDFAMRNGEKEQVFFDRIRVDSAGQTIATGYLSDSAGFKLSPEFGFYGNVLLSSQEKNFTYDGAFRTITTCLETRPSWVDFRAVLDPRKICIPVTDPPLNPVREKLSLAMVYSPAGNRVYPSFFQRPGSFSDSVMIRSSGFIEYSDAATEFRIADTSRLRDLTGPGNYIALNNTNCMVRGEGKISLGMKTGALRIENYGMVDHYIIPDSTRMRVAMAWNFPFSDAAMEKLIGNLESINLQGLQVFSTPYATAMKQLMKPQDLQKYKEELELVGKARKFPEELVRTLFFADITLSYDSVTQSWRSSGLIGIGSIGNRQVNRYVKGIIEFTRKKTGGDIFQIYLQISNDDWYFFSHRENLMQTLSSNIEYNDIIREAVLSKTERKRVNKIAKGFIYQPALEKMKRDFLRKFETE